MKNKSKVMILKSGVKDWEDCCQSSPLISSEREYLQELCQVLISPACGCGISIPTTGTKLTRF